MISSAPKPYDANNLRLPNALESGVPFWTSVFFMIFTFLNIPNRAQFIGLLHPTVIFIGMLFIMVLAHGEAVKDRLASSGARWVMRLVLYILITLPLVQFPGSIIHKNFESFTKWAIFFILISAFADTEKRLKIISLTFLFCTVFRVLEPLYLHVFQGYWGSITYWNQGADSMNRLAGSPADSVNGNGLAFLCVSTLPFLHFWAMCRGAPFIRKLIYCALAPAIIYALVLTASRSGMIGLALVVFGIIFFAKRKTVGVVLVVCAIAWAIPHLNANQVDRYASLVDSSAHQAGGVQGRINGITSNLVLWSKHPLFGFGLGTSGEASWQVQGDSHLAHDLYAETLIELGLGGFIIMMSYLVSIGKVTTSMVKSIKKTGDSLPDGHVLLWLPKALFVWTIMCYVFSIASYGLSEYQWYLVGGLSMVCYRMLAVRNALPAALALHQDSSVLSAPILSPALSKLTRIVSRRRIAAADPAETPRV
jgi:putative inorganic carbon (hco3(-)) transporter